MARISEKAVRPRQYAFPRLAPERVATLVPGVRKLHEQERRQALAARAAIRAADRHVAARHAENIMAGNTNPVPENDHIGALERELAELRSRKRALFESLRKSLVNPPHVAGERARSDIPHREIGTRNIPGFPVLPSSAHGRIEARQDARRFPLPLTSRKIEPALNAPGTLRARQAAATVTVASSNGSGTRRGSGLSSKGRPEESSRNPRSSPRDN